jgi:hypothetical protein
LVCRSRTLQQPAVFWAQAHISCDAFAWSDG